MIPEETLIQPDDSTKSMAYADPVYGVQHLPPVVRSIIRTEHFQRLQHIKQLGVCNYVFKDANHTRYEHSLGVCCLVVGFLETIEHNTKQSNIAINCSADVEFYKLCVILAGLLHDIGHGPYSHMWEPFVHTGNDKHWQHENSSCDIVAHLFDTSAIRLCADRQRHEIGVRLIGALIRGDEAHCARTLGPDLHYLAEIVNNKYCLIDVDKWDYLVRDVHHLHADAMRVPLDRTFDECFRRARVVRLADGEPTHIGFHERTLGAVRALFANRALMHRQCYQNVRVVGVEILMRRIFQLAEAEGFRFEGHKLSECHQHHSVYQQLNDGIVQQIATSTDPRLRRAQQITHLLNNPEQYEVRFDEHTQIVQVNVHNNNENGANGELDKTMSYRLHLPDSTESLPERLILFGDDGWTAEVNPKTYTPRR